jgi:hypothetical protein
MEQELVNYFIYMYKIKALTYKFGKVDELLRHNYNLFPINFILSELTKEEYEILEYTFGVKSYQIHS